jgi:NADPH:quinone reductase-like Zn-dependent oxidoreductase
METTMMQTTTMRAAVVHRFGGPEVVQVERVPKPVPKSDELLVRVHASTVSIADHRTRSRDLPKGMWFYVPIALGVFRPRKRVLGMDAAGVVEAVGDEVTGFAPGDEVIAMLGGAFGAHAEYARVPQSDAIALKPRNLTFEESASLVFGGYTALAYLNRVKLGPGSEVLVNGASGAVGTAVVQLAKQRGATVTGVCSAGKADLVRSLGADHVIDRASEDFATSGRTYDVIVECGGDAPFERVEHSLKSGGALLLVITSLGGMLTASRHTRRSGKTVAFTPMPVSHEDLAGLSRLAEEGRIRPVIDRTFDLDDIVEAHRYVDSGRKRGNVVLRIP